MARWWGPEGFTNPVCELDVRPGGKFLISMCDPGGIDHPFRGEYLEVERPARLVYRNESYDHPDEWHDLVLPNRRPGERAPAPVTTVLFEDMGGKTRMTIIMSFANTALRDAHIEIGMHAGWTESMLKLDGLVAETSGNVTDAISLRVRRRLQATAQQVFDAWLDPEVARRFLFATPGGVMKRVEIDARVGGRFVIVEQRGEVEAYHTGMYLALERPQLLLFSFSVDPTLADASRVRIEINDEGDTCEVVLTHELDRKWEAYLERSRAGWSKMLDSLDATIAGA